MKSKIFSKAGILRNNRLSNVTKRKLISMVYLPRRLITILRWWGKKTVHMLFNINKQTFSLEIIFPLDPVIEQVKNLLKHGH